jgi:hypothetical protein
MYNVHNLQIMYGVFMRFLLALLTLTGALGLSACASRPDTITQRLSATPQEKYSYVIGTYVVTCEPRKERCDQAFNEISTAFRSADDKTAYRALNSVSGSIFNKNTVYDFVDQTRKEKGFHFCIPLPAGDYGFFAFNFYNYAGGGSGYWIGEKNVFNLPFSLAAGEVAYVGRLKIKTTSGMVSMRFPAPGILLLSSDNAEVQRTALQKCPEGVRTRPIRDASLKPSMANGNPLVQADGGR